MSNFKSLSIKGDHMQYLECKCGHRFWTDPCGEENLIWDEEKKVLVPQCPSCKII